MSTIVNSAQRTAYNPPSMYASSLNNALSGSPTTTTLALPTAITAGFVRVKFTNGGSSSTAVTFTITGTDGTATILVGALQTAYTIAAQANSGADMTFPINADINVNSISVVDTLTVGTTTANLDIEVWGNP